MVGAGCESPWVVHYGIDFPVAANYTLHVRCAAVGSPGANVRDTPPLTFGSHRSKLVEWIHKDPCRANLTGQQFIRIDTWIDANAPYYGTHRGKKNLRWKEEPDFRPLPLAGKCYSSSAPYLPSSDSIGIGQHTRKPTL